MKFKRALDTRRLEMMFNEKLKNTLHRRILLCKTRDENSLLSHCFEINLFIMIEGDNTLFSMITDQISFDHFVQAFQYWINSTLVVILAIYKSMKSENV